MCITLESMTIMAGSDSLNTSQETAKETEACGKYNQNFSLWSYDEYDEYDENEE